MRRIETVELVLCNNCETQIQKESDLNVVTLTINGVDYPTDWCAKCHNKLMKTIGYNGNSELACGYKDCDFIGKTEGGLQNHRTRMKHPRNRRGQL